MVQFDELVRFLKHKGINDVFEVLSQFSNFRAEIHQFYNKLNEFSYYNSFFRVRERLLDAGIIEIKKGRKANYISLTAKGKEIYRKLTELNDIIKS